jgi:GNAT superfamily N-acetyltransferase
MENFKDLPCFRLFPYSCIYCAFWEQLGFDDYTPREKAEETKRKWFTDVRKKFGNCGLIAYVDDKPVGFAEYARAEFFPSTAKYGSLVPSRDTVFLACLYIPKRELRGKGIGKQILEEVTYDLKSRGYRAVEALARTSDIPSDNIPDWYTGPLGFFLRMGFRVKKKNGQIALVRKELE